MNKTNDVIGLGNLLVDFLVEVDDTKLNEFNLNKGEMHLVEEEQAKTILGNIQNYETAPGGSAANTIRGVGFLGGKSILCGKVGEDSHGELFIQQMQQHGVKTNVNKHHKTTGHAVTFITPDTERTFSVHLGAAVHLTKEDLNEEEIKDSKVLYLEAYQFEGQTKETLLHAMEIAKNNNTLIAIDLADPALVRRNKEFFKEIVRDYVDILFTNENEAKEFTNLDEEEAVKELGKDVKIAVVKIGERGSLISYNNETIKIPIYKASAIDTTGAGDTYAAGFLYGYCNDWNLEDAGKLGSLFSSKIVEEKGVKMENINTDELKNKITNKIKIGIIGGSGLDNPNILQDVQEINLTTPYGDPSSSLKTGRINNVDVVIIARHGREHTIPPTQVNFRANIHALKEIGCTHILATTACGSLRQEIGRGDFVILDQFIDFTRHRKITFHEEFQPHQPTHTPMATPFDKNLRNSLIDSCTQLGLKFHDKGTVVTIEGPRFSTKAESHMFRSWGADVINMSITPEVSLANELKIPYAAIAMSTDYDCWKDDEVPVTWEEVLKVFEQNVEKVTNLLVSTIPKVCGERIEEIKKEEFDLKSTVRTIPNWPKQGIMFRDITTLIENPQAFNYCIEKLKEKYQDKKIDKIAGIESRGFIFGAPLAKELGLPFVLIRKKGKLPGEVVAQEYELEYGTDKIEIHRNSINSGDNVLVIDDLLATGGTMKAACQLIEKLEGKVAGVTFVIDLPDLKGKEKLTNYDIFNLIEFEGD